MGATPTHTIDTARGTYTIEREGRSWGVYWEGSRFAAAASLAEARAIVALSVRQATR